METIFRMHVMRSGHAPANLVSTNNIFSGACNNGYGGFSKRGYLGTLDNIQGCQGTPFLRNPHNIGITMGPCMALLGIF